MIFKPWMVMCWTASAAGWAVLAWVTDVPEAAYTAVGCLIMAGIFNELIE